MPLQEIGFLERIAFIFGTVSVGLCGVILAGSALFPELGAKYKGVLNDVLFALFPTALAVLLFAAARLVGR